MQNLPHLTQFAHNRHQNRHIALYNHYRKIEDMKREPSSWGSNPRPCAPQVRCDAALSERLVVPVFQRPDNVAKQQDICTGTQRSLFQCLDCSRPHPVLHIHLNSSIPQLGLQHCATSACFVKNAFQETGRLLSCFHSLSFNLLAQILINYKTLSDSPHWFLRTATCLILVFDLSAGWRSQAAIRQWVSRNWDSIDFKTEKSPRIQRCNGPAGS